MISVNQIQADFVAWLKSKTSVTSLLTAGAVEIRETQWEGTEFTYPNIRVAVDLSPNQCAPHDVQIQVIGASEQKSSKQVNAIISAVVDLVQEKSFKYQSTQFIGLKIRNIPKADRDENNIWATDIQIEGLVV